jgi:hypothetical protein
MCPLRALFAAAAAAARSLPLCAETRLALLLAAELRQRFDDRAVVDRRSMWRQPNHQHDELSRDVDALRKRSTPPRQHVASFLDFQRAGGVWEPVGRRRESMRSAGMPRRRRCSSH